MTTAVAEPKTDPVDGTLSLDGELEFIMHLGRDVLGYTELDTLHIDWFRDALTSRKLLYIAPRDHFKTTVFTMVYVIYRIVRNPSIRILLLNEILGNAKDFLREITGHFERNTRFREQFGALDRNAPKWTEVAIQIESSRLTKDPTISVAGTLGAINSKHVDLIIGDDVISGKNTETAHQRNKTNKWLFQTVFPILDPRCGQMILAGTRWHIADMYNEFLNTKRTKRFANWKKVVLKAEWKDQDGKHHILFPERFSKETLEEKKLEMGSAFYNAQYLNDPTELHGEGFQQGWLKFYETPPATMSIFQGADLAISKKEKSAKFAHVTIGIPPEGDIYILKIIYEKLTFPQQCRTMKSSAIKYNPIGVGIENEAYQDALPQWLRADPESKKYPWYGVKHSSEKKMRLTSLSALFEAGVIYIREEMYDFIDEYLAFPSGSTFDILDGLFFAIEVSKGRLVEPGIIEVEL